MKCISCGKEFKEGAVFKCPSCGKEIIARCLRCKKLVIKYLCKNCGFEGP